MDMRSVIQCSVQTLSQLTPGAGRSWDGEEVFNFEVLCRSGFIQSLESVSFLPKVLSKKCHLKIL